MRDPHLNIFHAYRGAADTDAAQDRQLEDNLTRALAITLAAARGTPLAQPILAALHVPQQARGEGFECALQVNDAPKLPPSTKTRKLVVIHGGPKLQVEAPTTGGAAKCGRPNALFLGTSWAAGIEAKVGNCVSRSQLDRHWRTLGFPGQVHHEDVTWGALAKAAREAAQHTADNAVPHFIVSQFEEYLRMSGFGGFTEEHFSYLALSPARRAEQPVTKDGLRRTLDDLARGLGERWPTNWESKVGNVLKDADAWVVLSPRTGNVGGHQPHLTVAAGAAGLTIMANIETERPHRRFREALDSEPDGFLDFLLGLKSPRKSNIAWRLSVVRRVGKQPRQFWTPPALDISPEMARRFSRPALLDLVKTATAKPVTEAAPEIMVRKDHPAAAVVAEENIVNTLATDARALEPFFTWLGLPVR